MACVGRLSRHLLRAFAVAVGLLGALLGLSWAAGHQDLWSDIHIPGGGALGSSGRRLAVSELVHVCLCSDGADLRSVVATIRSVHASASAELPIEVHGDAAVQARLHALAPPSPEGETTGSGFGPFALAPLFLDDFVGSSAGDASRLVFIDAGAIVLGDVAELQTMDLNGHPCAAVRPCAARWSDLMNFDALRSAGFSDRLDPSACAASRTVIVIDRHRWHEAGVQGRIEQWLDRAHGLAARGGAVELWAGGPSRVPWLLAIGNEFAQLGAEWACAGLGHEVMSQEESQAIRRSGFDKRALRKLGLRVDEVGGRLVAQSPVCALPDGWRPTSASAALWGSGKDAGMRVKVFCQGSTFVNCSSIWWRFMPEALACALQDFEGEWAEAEAAWSEAKEVYDWKLDQESQRASDGVDTLARQEGRLPRRRRVRVGLAHLQERSVEAAEEAQRGVAGGGEAAGEAHRGPGGGDGEGGAAPHRSGANRSPPEAGSGG
eukprot:CAMPEP_0177573590 /NCGR_PEP_ID=MMETSP0369-20130122/78607_1 /TAXON_ID=447022 ORGANISM="Scrippsiella hangoei-like, Strain SHHI-4" /NCGR_SAMPLE_ID=MMETSP0369 /ASSEMBLY_ACC=CAM_ASM_000364 /LENGTH=490 /DNA_ID=CAMNT_0019061709 /DNA_START=1 /DNA_END=1470 /DNA_ORIENTATION=+